MHKLMEHRMFHVFEDFVLSKFQALHNPYKLINFFFGLSKSCGNALAIRKLGIKLFCEKKCYLFSWNI